ncbi:hypothetical protein WJ438_23340 [Streptomyces sp. GD-15H]|uniref:hypothetical protein n=1 Tax=Streptomyces sp. GD-15H TaxID=3129112 RepID=UPI0032531369
MPNPQQPEMRRSGEGASTPQDGRELKASQESRAGPRLTARTVTTRVAARAVARLPHGALTNRSKETTPEGDR